MPIAVQYRITPKSVKAFVKTYGVDGDDCDKLQSYRIYLETNIEVHHYGDSLSLSEWLVNATVEYYASK